jgi:hypothetical protein
LGITLAIKAILAACASIYDSLYGHAAIGRRSELLSSGDTAVSCERFVWGEPLPGRRGMYDVVICADWYVLGANIWSTEKKEING